MSPQRPCRRRFHRLQLMLDSSNRGDAAAEDGEGRSEDGGVNAEEASPLCTSSPSGTSQGAAAAAGSDRAALPELRDLASDLLAAHCSLSVMKLIVVATASMLCCSSPPAASSTLGRSLPVPVTVAALCCCPPPPASSDRATDPSGCTPSGQQAAASSASASACRGAAVAASADFRAASSLINLTLSSASARSLVQAARAACAQVW